MGIKYDARHRVFKLDTRHTTYAMGIVDEEKFLGHIYYGKKIDSMNLSYLLRTEEAPFVPSKSNRDRLAFMDVFPTEYSTSGAGDFREAALGVRTEEGYRVSCLTYQSHNIYPGKEKMERLPSTFGTMEECTTLEIVCCDPVLKFLVILQYTVFEDVDVIARSVRIVNDGKGPVWLNRVMSLCMDMEDQDYDMMTLHGGWQRERHIQRKSLGFGRHSVSSVRGETSHQEQPFLVLLERNADQEKGAVYGFNLVYSGNFLTEVQVDQHRMIRLLTGINPEGFTWKLDPGEEFHAPEAVMTFSECGIGGMTRSFHDLYRKHLMRGTYVYANRPLLVNSWEGAGFHIDSKKILSMAEAALPLGIEMLVMDDGWFGHRIDDNSSLGDWWIDEERFPGGLSPMVEKLNRMGMGFGIWFEPEMVSLDSETYRNHPDWVLAVPGRMGTLSRNQYVLDFSREDVRDYIYGQIKAVLLSANIEYVKWDMNRALTDVGSGALSADRQGEVFHRYVLGLYEMQERLITEFPHILLENCSGGGGRFDAGMLSYSPQIWCSDNTDPIERLMIQEGTAMAYPLASMGAHVSGGGWHQADLKTKGYVAMEGAFGYEFDPEALTSEEMDLIREQVLMYHKYQGLIREGDYYRIASYQANHEYDCWEVVSKDKAEVLLTYIQVYARPKARSQRIRLAGLDLTAIYILEETGGEWRGDLLMNAGILVKIVGDGQGKQYHFIKKPEGIK